MRLENDSLYDPSNPEGSPCRWSITVRDCVDSTFFVVCLAISLVLALITILSSFTLMARHAQRRGMALSPWEWPLRRLSALALFATAISQAVADLVFLIDPPSPYWIRTPIFIMPLILGYVEIIPYMTGILASRILDYASHPISIPFKQHIRRTVLYLPTGFIGVLILAGMAGGFMEGGKMKESDIFWTVAAILSALLSGLLAIVCIIYGTTAARAMQRQVRRTLAQSTLAEGIPEIITSQPVSARRRAEEAERSLRRMWYLNSIGAFTGISAMIGCIVLAILPSRIYAIPVLSKLVFFVLVNTIAIRTCVVSLLFLRDDLYPRVPSGRSISTIHGVSHSFKDDHICDKSIIDLPPLEPQYT